MIEPGAQLLEILHAVYFDTTGILLKLDAKFISKTSTD